MKFQPGIRTLCEWWLSVVTVLGYCVEVNKTAPKKCIDKTKWIRTEFLRLYNKSTLNFLHIVISLIHSIIVFFVYKSLTMYVFLNVFCILVKVIFLEFFVLTLRNILVLTFFLTMSMFTFYQCMCECKYICYYKNIFFNGSVFRVEFCSLWKVIWYINCLKSALETTNGLTDLLPKWFINLTVQAKKMLLVSFQSRTF